ncbi:MAG: XRE family transcriptional regulator [Verrucomicrobiales bacterium]|nr:MAG: XRE family transcriptional regulator [Verrucomicrobiales bacterium]
MTKSLYTAEWEALLEILRDARGKRELTQEQLAKKLDRPQSLVAKIEAGERKLDVCQFIDYMRVLECDPVAAMRKILKKIEKP